ncbi:MAG: MBL fold metallo-hydrolase [Firmicutes bacterium]|nr:MBL fold metallo-hydrolase [Bacillota bacterium]
MELHVIGRSSPYAGPGEATVGYVVAEENTHLILECGSGVIAKYLERYNLADLEGVMISHLHPDHCADLFPLGFAIKHAQMQGLREERVPLLLPPGGIDILNGVLALLGGLGAHYREVFDYEEYGPKDPVILGYWQAHFHRVDHGMNCHGVVIKGAKGQKLGYTGDTKMGPELVEFFQGTDLLLCEATVESEEQGESTGHLTAEQAGKLGAAAEAKELVLTHFLPGVDEDKKKLLASRHFSGQVTIAEADKVYSIG